MLARQGDWIRVAELLLRDGNYRGSEVIRPGWVQLMRAPARGDPDYGMYVRLGAHVPAGIDPYAAGDTYLVDGGGGNRLWLVPSMQIAMLMHGRHAACSAPLGRGAHSQPGRHRSARLRAARRTSGRGHLRDRPRALARVGRGLNRQLAALFLFCVIDTLGFGLLIPLVPYMADRFGAAPALITPILGSYSLCQLHRCAAGGDA